MRTAPSGGNQFVSSGGVVSGTAVSGGGNENGGVASGTVVNSGGNETVYGGGLAIGTATLSDDTLTLAADGATYILSLRGDYTGEYAHLANDGAGGTDITLDTVPCYLRGTRLLTDRGEVPVEDLRIGDNLVTVSGEARPISWIGTRYYARPFSRRTPEVWPVRIRRGALGDGLPRRDLYVSPGHAMFIDGMLILAIALTNGSSIVQIEPMERITYFYLELETHDVILAEGAPSETFIDDDSRGMFHNAHEYRALYPDTPREPARFCAPRVEDGYELEAVRERLAAVMTEA